jgi:Zn-dependent protease
MLTSRQGSIHLFRFSGIDVFLHWSWFLVAAYEIRSRAGSYSSVSWNILEYVGLFLIVLLHEFGHALACRQVGGKADRIVLWPLGGVAYVDPPQRPGATLWSIAAGPLVNVVLVLPLGVFYVLGNSSNWHAVSPDLYHLVQALFWINVGLLAFNVLPIYPLDGGQILRSLLWFLMGRARSLMVATIIGFLGVAGFIVAALVWQDLLLGAIAVFMLMNCWGGLRHAQSLLKMAKLPKREQYSCPNCKTSPPIGPYWRCRHCGQAFDTFEASAVCPYCSTRFPATQCLSCGQQHPLIDWATPTVVAPTIQYAQPGSEISAK